MTMPNFRMEQHTALVTGAASGIGRGIALGLAAAGATVACFELSESALDEVCDEIRMAGQDAIAVPGDVMDAEMLANAVRDAEGELGPLSLAVNSAGIANAAPAEELSLSQWQRVIDINVTGVFLSCH
jgi:NAD(P)-dependent dehydrogenase (short-subunit alcohol dehydrogenase family)